MYLDRQELNNLLTKNYFKNFLSKNVSHYALYRKHFNVSVLTLRYSLLAPEFTENKMHNSIINEVFSFFPPSTKTVRGLIEYDVILKSNILDQENPSYYFWRANSNVNPVPNRETLINFTHDAIFLFIQSAAHIMPTDLDIFYANSNVSVETITSIIFTFM